MAANLQQIEDMFHRAMGISPDERTRYLDDVCEQDGNLRREVDSLIAAYESSSGLLDEGAVTLAMKVLGSGPVPSMVGQEVGPYKILSALGHGGMGTVYLAENRRVNKKVALKFLSSDFITDNWAKRQLIKEAQAVARLDHPNICAVYDFEEIGEHSFIVMQYIEGQTLSDLIRKKSLQSGQVVNVAQQIANALADAHAHGIIHRDIKPKNIMVTPSEQVKVLDFGLAKTIQKNLEDATDSISHLSREGLLVGTIAYMSPEQLRGERLDYRTDIFSLGTVLYEMIWGKNPFAHRADSRSKSNAEVISSIMSDEPPSLRQVSINCPNDFDHVVNKCLRKNPTDRYQSAAELLIDLENLQKGIALPATVSSNSYLRFAAIAVALLLVVFVAAAIYLRTWGNSGQTLAVLPIVCDEVVTSQCAGPAMTEGLVRTLSRRNGLRVTSSQVAPSLFGPNAASPQRVGRDLDADMVMFGRIRQGEQGQILTIRLERVKDGFRVWEKSYPVNPEKISTLQQRVSLETAFELQLPTNEDDKALFELVAADDNRSTDAYRLYLLGRKNWALRDGENIKSAIENFRRATELDPAYAEAYAGLSDCYVLMNTPAYGPLARKDAITRAEWAAKQALKYGENLADAHNAYAAVLMKGYWDWENAEREFKRAIALNPDYEPAHWGYSNLLATTGRLQESLVESELAMNQDPFSAPAIMNHCRTQYFARQFNQADACLERLASEQPAYVGGKYMHGIVYLELGRIQEAIQIFEEIYAKDKLYGGAMLGFSYGIANRRADAERILNEMQQLKAEQDLKKDKYVSDQELGIIYLGLNDLEHAFPLFRNAVEDKFPPAQSIFIAPMFDRLRADPRFAGLAREVRLPSHPPTASTPANVSAK
jgi:serine/threonine protein kinase/TolB-like protein/Tfp pilus assembly protein PilF